MNKMIALLLIVFSGCATALSPSPATQVCPHVYTWTPAQLRQAGIEDASLPESSAAHRAIAEDFDIRAQIHAACPQ